MQENTLLKHFFNARAEVDPEKQFDLNRKSRVRRMREIVHILNKHHFMQGFSPEEFRALLEDLGPSFIKIGQTLSTRSEILPRAYCEALSQLQQECDPLPFDQVLNALSVIYGEDRDKIFVEIDPTPLGSASLAQVHKATLADGTRVALKVQRPGVRATMAQDIDVMRSVARHLSSFMKDTQMVDLREVVEELWTTFLEETDFIKEAQNLKEFNELNADVVYIAAPNPYMEYCREEILVMDYIEGISIKDTKGLLKAGYDLEEIGAKMLDNYAKQILTDGFFHADPHPGNIFISEGQIVYLDLGIMGRLTKRDREGFDRIIEAVGLKSASKLMDALLSFSVSRDVISIDRARLLSELDVIIERYGSTDVAEIDIGAMLSDIMIVTRQSKVMLPPSVTMVSRGIVTMEGTLANFVGKFNIIDIINQHISRQKEESLDLENMVQRAAKSLISAGDGLLRAAKYSGDTIKQVSRGQLKINMEMLGSGEPLKKLSRIINRLTVGMIIAGLLVSASLIATAIESEPQLWGMPVIAVIEFVSAFILSLWIAFDIFRRRNG